MGLYTVRVRMQPLPSPNRGAGYCEMTHHLHFDDDAAAGDAIEPLIGAWNDSGIANRWLCVRGVAVHSIDMYRRDITNARSWVHIAAGVFQLSNWQNFEVPVELPGGVTPFEFAVRPIFPHQRGAVLCVENTLDRAIKRRVYVGPISPVAFYNSTLLGLGNSSSWLPYPVLGDFPLDPEQDTIDLWRSDFRDLAVEHVANIEDHANDGYSVVPSWKNGTIQSVLQVQGSTVRAEIRSRGLRAPMGPPNNG